MEPWLTKAHLSEWTDISVSISIDDYTDHLSCEKATKRGGKKRF